MNTKYHWDVKRSYDDIFSLEEFFDFFVKPEVSKSEYEEITGRFKELLGDLYKETWVYLGDYVMNFEEMVEFEYNYVNDSIIERGTGKYYIDGEIEVAIGIGEEEVDAFEVSFTGRIGDNQEEIVLEEGEFDYETVMELVDLIYKKLSQYLGQNR